MTLRPGPRDSMEDLAGIRVGHAQVSGGGSGCTVLLGPFRARVEAPGLAGGSREFATLHPAHVSGVADALLLTGGSAYGLSAADGVMRWLEGRGRGFGVSHGVVPIVPAAVLYDLAPGVGRPGVAEGEAACEDAAKREGPARWGRVGAGAGARVGRILGAERAMPGGVGSASFRLGEWTVAGLAVVNALGAVTDARGRIVAGARPGPDAPPEDPLPRLLAEIDGQGEGVRGPLNARAGEQTTLAAVATDAPLTEADLARVLRVAGTALPRRIHPVYTPFDGDAVFGVVPAGRERSEVGTPLPLEVVLALGVAARDALETAIERAVQEEGE